MLCLVLRGVSAVGLLTVLPACCGCGFSQGQLLWAMGFGSGMKVPAEFELSKDGPLLVLVDDPEERLYSPRSRTELAEKVGDDLQARGAVKALVKQAKISRLRRERMDFEDLSCREVGELAGAEQVLWLQVRDFYAESEVAEASAAARMAVTVRVINPGAKERNEVRLWPVEHRGRIVSTELDATDVIRAKTPTAISGKLTDQMAVEVGKLFYDHPAEEL
jgi:hypothetical protein